MKRRCVLVAFLVFVTSSVSQNSSGGSSQPRAGTLHVEEVDGGSVVTGLGYGIHVNKGVDSQTALVCSQRSL